MRIINLIENTKGIKRCLFEHGLSFYIETEMHKLLVDTGATGAFIKNAWELGIDLRQVDLVILSHGHYDHAGGILEFAEINQDAAIYMQKNAGDGYYHKNDQMEKYIGIDQRIMALPQVTQIDGNLKIDSEISLFSKVTKRRLFPEGNLELKCRQGDAFVQDNFSHEQYLVISQGGKQILVSGCAHNGILNILEKYHTIYGRNPDMVISGFHMQKKTDYSEKDIAVMQETARELKKTDTVFYTGHCTGEYPYEVMREILGGQLIYVHSGDEILCN